MEEKTLAVDVSIWLTQFIKAMRDDEGKVVKNAHIIGTLRRVVKLLFHRIRPVFVFDGGAPALKGRTLAARRKLRSEGTNASLRKTAQRILASQLKKHKVALNAAKRHADSAPTATFTPVYQSSDADLKASSEATTRVGSSTPVESNDVSEEPTREVVGETSIEADGGSIGDTSAGETEGGKRKRERNDNASTKSASREDEVSVTSKAFTTGRGSHEGGHVGHDDGDDDDDGVDWEEGGGIEDGGDGDGALRADREAPKNNDRGEASAETRGYGDGAENGTERQGAAATDAERSEEDAPWAVDTDDEEGEGDRDWEEVDLPEDDRDIDPEVIASLPDHMKKQVIEAAKRRQRMRSRAQYMPVAGDPALYSQTQLSNFLRGQRLNSQIMLAHKQDDGDREGKKIASEAGRRYIMIPAAGLKSSGRTPTSDLAASRKQRYASPSKDAPKGRRRRIAGDDSDDFEEWSYDRSRSTASRKARGSGGAGDAAPSVVVLESNKKDKKEGTGGKRNIRVLLEDDEEEAGGFLPQKPERGDDDSALATRSIRGEGSGGKLCSEAGRRAVTEGAGKGKGKSKVRAPGGDDGKDNSFDDDEDEGVEESEGSGCAPSSMKAAAAVGGGSPFRFDPGAADDVIARGLQEEEDRRAAMVLRDEDEIHSAGGVANERSAVLTDAFAPGADGSRGNNSGLTSNTSDIASTGEWRNRGRSAPCPPEHSGLGRHEAARSPGEVTSVVHVRPEPEEVEIELEIDPSSLAGEGSRSEFWEIVGSDAAEAGARTAAQAKSNGCSNGGGRGGFFDDFEGHDMAPSQGPSTTVPNDVALKRSVDMASRMAGWAGRVVERVLKEHHRQAGDEAAARSSTAPAHHVTRPSIPGESSNNSGGRSRRITSREGAVGVGITAASGPAPPETGTKEFSKIAAEAVDGERRLSLLSDKSEKLGFHEGQSVRRGTLLVETEGVEGDSEGSHAAEVESGSVRHRDMANVKERFTGKEADRRRVEVGTVTRVSLPGRRDGVVLTGDCDRSEKLICTEEVEAEAKPSDEIQRDVAAKAAAVAAGFLVEDTFSTRNPSRESPRAERAVEASTTDRSTPKIRVEQTPEDHGALARTDGVSKTEICGSGQGDETPGNFSSAEVAEATLDGVGDESDYSHGERAPDRLRRAGAASLLPGGKRGEEPSLLAGDTSKVRSGIVEGDVSEGGRETPAAVFRSEGGEWPDSDDHYAAAAHDGIGEGRQGGVPGFGVGSIGAGGDLDVGHLDEGDVSRLMGMDEEELGAESERMRREGNKAQRDAETVTDEMKEEVMDLLKLFGVPYVIAPMEAEAQCCELERLKLVDGTVTDDSDAFAFGGKVVYKNIFSDRKFVEAYVLPDLEKDLGIGTDEVVALAMLLGSDYTEGVRGVGIVNAMEIINAFPLEGRGPYHGLSKFKEWIEGFDPVLDQELESLLKRGSSKEIESLSLETKFHLKHRSARNRWTVSEGFPSKEVINAYKNPQVDKSEEPFSWATPDVDGLRALCKRVLGWDRHQSDGLLMPMVKELGRGTFSQPRIDRYFMTYHDNRRVAAIKSKRLRSAVEDLASGSTEVMTIKDSAAAGEVKGRKNIGQRHKGDYPLADIGAGEATPPASAKRAKASLKDAPSGRKGRQSARVVLSEEDLDDCADRVSCEDASPKKKRPRPSPAESVAIAESNGSFYSSRSSRRTRGGGSLAVGSASARPGKKQKNSESSRPSSTKLAEGRRLNPRRKAAAFRGGGGAGVVVGGEADTSGEDGDSSDGREDGDYEVSGESSDGGKELGAPHTERCPFGRRKGKRRKDVV